MVDLNSLDIVRLLTVDPDDELSLVVGFEGGWYDDVVARGQLVVVRHLPHVDVGWRASSRCVSLEETVIQGAAVRVVNLVM